MVLLLCGVFVVFILWGCFDCEVVCGNYFG